uniref:hypothetical protein n=1 Tax=Pseudomonas sivasensis TaxID=1880678 RepID=UPI003BA0968E
ALGCEAALKPNAARFQTACVVFMGAASRPSAGQARSLQQHATHLTTQLASYEALMNLARKPVGPVSIANSDAAWSAYAHAAIDEAFRAVREVG